MYDLPSEYPEDPGWPDQFHSWQSELLSDTFQLQKVAKDQVLISRNLNLHYDLKTPNSHIRPDWFAVLGVPRLYNGNDLRLSYVLWDEKVSPIAVVELILPGTLMADLGEVRREQNGLPNKFQIYEKILKVSNYIVFNPYKNRLWVFRLINGQYQEQDIIDGNYWFDDFEIGIGTWHGSFKGFTRTWIRWYDADRNRIPTLGEQLLERRSQRQEAELRAESESRRAEQERSQRQEAESENQRLKDRLREMGIDPDKV